MVFFLVDCSEGGCYWMGGDAGFRCLASLENGAGNLQIYFPHQSSFCPVANSGNGGTTPTLEANLNALGYCLIGKLSCKIIIIIVCK